VGKRDKPLSNNSKPKHEKIPDKPSILSEIRDEEDIRTFQSFLSLLFRCHEAENRFGATGVPTQSSGPQSHESDFLADNKVSKHGIK